MSKILPSTSFGTRTADYCRSHWHVVVTPDITLDDILRPGFWAHHVGSLNPMDLVDVVSQDMTLDVTLRVTGKGIGFVDMRPVRVYASEATQAGDDEPEIDLTVPEGYIVNHAPKTGWRVLTKDPHLEVSRNHKTRMEATLAAIEHSRRVQGQAAA